MFFKIGVLKDFAIFTGKHLCWSLPQNFIKKRLQHGCWNTCENCFSHRTPLVAVSQKNWDMSKIIPFSHLQCCCKSKKTIEEGVKLEIVYMVLGAILAAFTAQDMKFFIKDSFIEEILIGKLHFLCSDCIGGSKGFTFSFINFMIFCETYEIERGTKLIHFYKSKKLNSCLGFAFQKFNTKTRLSMSWMAKRDNSFDIKIGVRAWHPWP